MEMPRLVIMTTSIKSERRILLRNIATKIKKETKSITDVNHRSHDEWKYLCSLKELSCELTLASGQVFTWQKLMSTNEWIGVVGERVIALRERKEEDLVEYKCLHPMTTNVKEQKQIHDDIANYFRLETHVVPLYEKWSAQEDNMSRVIKSLPGLRIIRQDPVECLFGFICSSNNNIPRIWKMVENLKKHYGKSLFVHAHQDYTPNQSYEFYSFPSIEALAKCEEQHLRDLGFGYRAPFIQKTSEALLKKGGIAYLMQLRLSKDPVYVQKELQQFAGIGRKVADCIALFSLEQLDAIPVDTHVWQIACRDFDPSLKKKKSLTPSVYDAVGELFRNRFSPFAGWAHSVLFTGDLAAFKSFLPIDLQKQNDAQRQYEKDLKKENKSKKTSDETTIKSSNKRKASTTDTMETNSTRRNNSRSNNKSTRSSDKTLRRSTHNNYM